MRKRTSGFWYSCALLALFISAPILATVKTENSGSVSAQSLISKMKWRPVGPYIGGRVVAVAGVPGNANLFYMGAVDGGVWKSTNYGVKWENITDGKLPGSSHSIGAIAVAPSDAKILYIGTGESDIRADVITGDGVFKSTDSGKTWHYAGLADTHTISILAVDPKSPDVVYAASMGHVFKPNPERGVFKTTDGGKTWKKVLFVDEHTGAIDLCMDPKNPQVLYAAMWQAHRTPWGLVSGGPGSGLYKTTDGGAHWTNLSHNPGLPKGLLGRIGVSVAASSPNIVYTIMQAKEGGVFRSDDSGKTWTRVNDEWKLRQRAFYYMTIYADPKDPETAYVPEVDALWVTHDGGKAFKKLKTPHGDNHIVWINPNNTKILLEGNDGGATVSTDGGKTWSTEHNQPTGQFYHVNLDDQFPFHIYGAQQDEGSFEGPSATADRSIPLSAWHEVAYGESTFTVPQPGNPKITYGSGYYSIFMKYDMKTEQFEEVSPWPLYREGASAGEQKYRFAWTHPILFSPANPKEMLIGSQYVMKSDDYGKTWKKISPDLTRNEASTQVPSGGPIDLDQSGAEIYPTVFALAVSPLDGQLIWAGSDDGLVHVTTDGGAHWQAVTPPTLPESTRISSIEPSHVDKGTAYLTARRYMWDDFKPYVFETTDYGKHWNSITSGLPDDEYAFTIRQDPDEANLLFLGTKSTVYVSLDGGANWQPLSLNLPPVQVRDIQINSRQGDVVIATHGRAFWILDDLALLEQLTKSPRVNGDQAYLFAPQQAWLTHAYGSPSSEERQPVNAGVNPPFGATVFFHIPAGYDGKTPATLEFADAQGHVIRSLKLHLKAKMTKEEEKKEKEKEEANEYVKTTVQLRREAEKKLTGIEPGMNRFQWNLRYPDATEVEGFHSPMAAGGLDNSVEGPTVTPGTYTVALEYGGRKSQQSFRVALDPRIEAGPQALDARLKLLLQIHETLDRLNKTINQAISRRDRLQAAVGKHSLTKAQAAAALSQLDGAIGDVVQMKIKSSEGDLLHQPKLRSHFAYLAADVGLTYGQPTEAVYGVFQTLSQQAKTGEQKLAAAIAEADKLMEGEKAAP
jgi:photosystem II stability/assembly factor-like uncharacterized protein